MLRHLAPDLRLEKPRVNLGAFTETDYAIYSRQVRLLSKVVLAGLDKFSSEEAAAGQLAATAAIAGFNLLVNICFPPLLDPRLMSMVRLVFASCTAASCISWSSTAGPAVPAGFSREAHACAYLVVVSFPVLALLFGAPCGRGCTWLVLSCRRRSRKRVGCADWASQPHAATPPKPLPPQTFPGGRQDAATMAWPPEESGHSLTLRKAADDTTSDSVSSAPFSSAPPESPCSRAFIAQMSRDDDCLSHTLSLTRDFSR